MRQLRVLPLLIVAACTTQRTPPSVAAAPAATTPAAPKASQPVTARFPERIDGFTLTQRAGVIGVPTDSLFRYSNGTQTIITVFVFRPRPDVQVGPDSQQWTPREGAKFALTQEIRRARGEFAAFKVAVDDTWAMPVGSRTILEHLLVKTVNPHTGGTFVDAQYLYLIDGYFVKVRGTEPDGANSSAIPGFARALARHLAR